MRLRVLVFINALVVALTVGIVNYYFQNSWYYLVLTFVITLVTSFVVFYYLIEKYVYGKVKLIYKLIHNLKLGKDLKEALGEYVSDDPINDVEKEVKEWAKVKKTEIDDLKNQEKFRREFRPAFASAGLRSALTAPSRVHGYYPRQSTAGTSNKIAGRMLTGLPRLLSSSTCLLS